MAYTSIPASLREVGKPVTEDLINLIHTNLEDLNVRLASISIQAGGAVLVNQTIRRQQDQLPLGTIIHCSYSEAQLTAELDGGEWVLANGANVAGSDWATATGKTLLPDVRGRFLRAKSNGSGNSPADPALDTYTADTFVSHLHDMSHGHGHTITASSVATGSHSHDLAFTGTYRPDLAPYIAGDNYNAHFLATTQAAVGGAYSDYTLKGHSLADLGEPRGRSGTEASHSHTINIAGGVSSLSSNTGASGASETAPRHITENAFIKINKSHIRPNTKQLVLYIAQGIRINSIQVTPQEQGASGNLVVDIKHGATPNLATQSIFQSGNLPTLAFNSTTPATGLVDSNHNEVPAGKFVVVSIATTQSKLGAFHLFVGGDY